MLRSAAAAAGLSTTMPVWAALLIVCGALMVVGAVLGYVGVQMLQKGTNPVPEQAFEEAELTAEALRDPSSARPGGTERWRVSPSYAARSRTSGAS